MVQMRTIQQLAQAFKNEDEHTAVTSHAIRKLVKAGAIPSVRVGAKYLVCVEALESYLKGSVPDEQHTDE